MDLKNNTLAHANMKAWRQHLHRFPETAFEEIETARFVADKLRSFGLEVQEGLAKTGVVATLTVGASPKKIALRADMDALFIQEQNSFTHKSCHDGKMHACGHDGHTSMLLGAARQLQSVWLFCKLPYIKILIRFIFKVFHEKNITLDSFTLNKSFIASRIRFSKR